MARTSPLNREAYVTNSGHWECYDVVGVHLLLVVAFSIGPPSDSLDITSK